MVPDAVELQTFEGFVGAVEPRLRAALSAILGSEPGREAAGDALAYAWEHWSEVREMENPVGYLYVVGRQRGFRMRDRRVVLWEVDPARAPWVEPDLPAALASLPESQRAVVMLLHCFEWTMSEVAEVLQISKSTVQSHAERGMSRLRVRLGVKL
jgi:DNA-directed RNA polymerase specialized sigma24 family protein